MLKAVIITIFVYSFVITVVDIVKDASSYSMGLDGWIDVLVAGPVMWILLPLIKIYAIFHEKLRKNKVKKEKTYSEKQIRKTVQRFMKLYKKKCCDDYIWLKPENTYFVGGSEIERPSSLNLGTIRYELLEKKYKKMCRTQSDIVWTILCQISHPVTESEAWNTYKSNVSQSEWTSVENVKCIEIL